jgi:very-short-patch-repair endonuclease
MVEGASPGHTRETHADQQPRPGDAQGDERARGHALEPIARAQRRQADLPASHPFGHFILDFYCPAARLAIEVDGATHWEEAAEAKDRARDSWLGRQGVRVCRVPASEVYRDLTEVVDGILLQAEALMAADRGRQRLAPSTVGSTLRSADGPPPAASRGR